MYCINCGQEIKDDCKFCNHCGKEIKRVKDGYCSVCGGKLNPKNGLCMKCLMNKKKEEPVTIKKNSNSLKLNILLNLGVIMVLVAGFVLATTNWQTFSNLGKVLLLVGLSVFFMIMHLICDKKLKLNFSAYLYWLLSLAFVEFVGISLTYLEMFGHWFSLAGPGKFLCLASLALLFTFLAIITRLKYKRKWINLFVFAGIIVTIFFLCRYFGLGWLSNLAVLSLLMLLLYLYTKDSSLSIIAIIMCLAVILFEGFFVAIVRPEYNIIAGTMITVCNGLILFVFGYLQKNQLVKIFSSIVLFIFFMLFLNYSLIESTWVVSIMCGIMLLLLLMVLIINAINENNDVHDAFSITSKICCISSLLLIITTYVSIHRFQVFNSYYFNPMTDTLYYLINLAICSFILLLSDYICAKEKTTVHASFYTYILPVFAVMFAFNISRLLVNYVAGFTYSSCIMLFMIIILIQYLMSKPGIMKKIVHVVLYFLLFLAMFSFFGKNSLAIESLDGIIALLLPIISFVLYFREKKTSLLYSWLAIIIFTCSFINIIGTLDVFGFGRLISTIVVLATLVLITALFIDDMIIRRFIPFMIIIPLINLLDVLSLDASLSLMILNIFSFLVLYLFASSFTPGVYNTLFIIGSAILLFFPTMTFDIPLNIYASIVSILLMVYDLLSKKVKGIFVVGLVYLIINTLIELRDVWMHISIWTYLLIAGIAIIIFTTIALAKANKKKN